MPDKKAIGDIENALDDAHKRLNEAIAAITGHSEFITVRDFAKIIAKSEDLVRSWCREGRINSKRIPSTDGGEMSSFRIHGDEVLRYQKDGLLPVMSEQEKLEKRVADIEGKVDNLLGMLGIAIPPLEANIESKSEDETHGS